MAQTRTIQVTFADNSKKEFKSPLHLSRLLEEEAFTKVVVSDKENSNAIVKPGSDQILAARVNNYIVSLNSKVRYDKASIEPIYENSVIGKEILRHTLLFLVSMASHLEFPGHVFTAEHHLGWGYLFESSDLPISDETVERLSKRMDELVQRNLPICETERAHKDALEYFSTVCRRPYTVQLLEQANDPRVKLDCCDGYFEYHRRVIGPATGIVKDKFQIKRKDKTSFVVNFPPGM